MVLGQDQDLVGGGFNAAESLVGHLTGLHLWRGRLGGDKVRRLATLCQAQEEGDLYSWGQFHQGMYGHVEVTDMIDCTFFVFLEYVTLVYLKVTHSYFQ